MKARDQSQRFLFEDHPIRGQYASLDESWREIVQQGGLEGRAQSLLGEALVAVALLVDTLKIEGSITLQIRGAGPIELLVVEASSDHGVRGMARQTGNTDDAMDLQQVFGTEHLVITIRTEGAEPHQGIAELRGARLCDALEYYFETSEQLPTNFYLSCSEQNASGMLIQRIPGEMKDADAWDRVLQLASTIKDDELEYLSLEELLHRLFHEEALRLFDAHSVNFACSCSRERTAAMLLSIGKVEVDEILLQEENISVSCEFCNANYAFDRIDAELLFNGSAGTTDGVLN